MLRHRCALPLLAGLLAVCTPAAAEPQAPPAAGTPGAARADANSYRYLRVFDFDERALENYEDTPMYWQRLTGAGLPRYSAGRFDRDVGHTAPPAFRCDLRGGNIAYDYARNDLLITADSDYLVEAWIRAEGLEHAAAFVACYLVDRVGERRPGSERISQLVRGTTDWQRVTIPVTADDPDAYALRVQMWVLQDGAWQPPPPVPDPIVRETVAARVWFDDLMIYRTPRLRLTSSHPGGLLRPGTTESLRLEFHNATLMPAELRVALSGAEEPRRLLLSHDIAGTTADTLEVPLPPLAPGMYTATAELWAGGELLLARAIRLATLPDLGERAPRGSDCGFDLGPATPGDWAGARELINAAACGAVRIGLAPRDGGLAGAELQPLREFVRSLLVQRVDVTGVLLPPGGDGTTRAFLLNTREWPAHTAAVLAALGELLPTWQLGDEAREVPGVDGWTPADVLHVRRELDRFLAVPQLVVPRSVLDAGAAPQVFCDELPAPAAAAVGPADIAANPFALAWWIPPALPTAALPWHLAPLVPGTSGGGDAIWPVPAPHTWLTLGGEPEDIADFARRFVLAKAARPDRLFVPAPFERCPNSGSSQWQPTAAYVPIRTLMHYLGGLRAAAAVPLGPDTVALVFRNGDRAVLAAWTWQPEPVTASARLCLGKRAVGVDLWGRTIPLETDGLRTRVPLSGCPLLVVDVDAGLLLVENSFRIEPAFIQLHEPDVRPVLTLRNHFGRELAATLVIHAPPGWSLHPTTVPLTVQPGADFALPLALTPPARQVVGDVPLGLELSIDRPEPARLRFDVPLRVGLRDLDLDARTRWDGDDLIIEHTLANRSPAAVSFAAFCEVAGRARREAVLLDVMPGEARRTVYRMPKARSATVRQAWIGLREIRGPRTADQLVDFPP